MPLKTLVIVKNITNLSDARYCAGMGVDILGFQVIPGQPDYIEPGLFQQIRGWFAGPAVAVSIKGLQQPTEIEDIIRNYSPDYLEMSLSELRLLKTPSFPVILQISPDNHSTDVEPWKEHIVYLQTAEDALEKQLADFSGLPMVVELRSAKNLSIMLGNPLVKGISLQGSAESRPGYKDYDDLSEVLELLEVD